jgi:hypothetical protein
VLQSLTCGVEVPAWYRELQARHGQVQAPVRADERRRYARFHCLLPAVLECRGNLPMQPREPGRSLVLCKDVSRNGISFLHAEPLYPEEELSLWLRIGRRSYVVQRCRRHNARCYEIGAQTR